MKCGFRQAEKAGLKKPVWTQLIQMLEKVEEVRNLFAQYTFEIGGAKWFIGCGGVFFPSV
jgi:hypothetical protein